MNCNFLKYLLQSVLIGVLTKEEEKEREILNKNLMISNIVLHDIEAGILAFVFASPMLGSILFLFQGFSLAGECADDTAGWVIFGSIFFMLGSLIPLVLSVVTIVLIITSTVSAVECCKTPDVKVSKRSISLMRPCCITSGLIEIIAFVLVLIMFGPTLSLEEIPVQILCYIVLGLCVVGVLLYIPFVVVTILNNRAIGKME